MSEKEISFTPEDMPLWFVSFARHILRCCNEPGRYQITLHVPSADDQPREVAVWQMRRLRLLLCQNAARPRQK